jgi:hypothetical protein
MATTDKMIAMADARGPSPDASGTAIATGGGGGGGVGMLPAIGLVGAGGGLVAVAANTGDSGSAPPASGSSPPLTPEPPEPPGQCTQQTVTGTGDASPREFEMGQVAGVVPFSYDTYKDLDRIIVTYGGYGGEVLIDYDCNPDYPFYEGSFRYSGESTKIQVEVRACDEMYPDEWTYTIGCPEP